MMKRYVLIALFGILVCVLIMDVLVLEPPINYGSNLAYAMGPRPPRPDRPTPDKPPCRVPEPSTLLLLGTGALGLGFYLYRNRARKK